MARDALCRHARLTAAERQRKQSESLGLALVSAARLVQCVRWASRRASQAENNRRLTSRSARSAGIRSWLISHQKVKTKLGKKKAPAANATNTQFKTKGAQRAVKRRALLTPLCSHLSSRSIDRRGEGAGPRHDDAPNARAM